MRNIVRFIRIYTPFICTGMALVNGVLFKQGETELQSIYLFATLTGHSILVDLYVLVTSMRMCIWYKLNLFCLMMIQISGLLYNYYDLEEALYLWAVTLFSAFGVLCFLVFTVFYKVTRLFGCSRRRL